MGEAKWCSGAGACLAFVVTLKLLSLVVPFFSPIGLIVVVLFLPSASFIVFAVVFSLEVQLLITLVG
jgi:hypothetical protein